MTVSELIAALQKFPADMIVTVGGFDEWGYDDVGPLTTEVVTPIKQQGHGPCYDIAQHIGSNQTVTGKPVEVVFLGREY